MTVNVQAPGTSDLEPTSYSPNPTCSSACNEGGSRSFTMWVRNNGTVTAPVTTVVMLFDGSPAPNPYGGLCNVGPIAPGATASCTNVNPVSLTFPGGNVSVKADYNKDGCWWRITVRANGQHSTHSSVVTSSTVQK